MTISSTVRTAGPFSGNNATTVFPFAFKVFQASDLLVSKTDASGTQTTMVLSVDFTVTLNANQNTAPGGFITTTVPLPSTYTMLITSALPLLQPLSLSVNGGFYPSSLEDEFDRLTILMQQNSAGVLQALRVPETGGVAVLPAAATRANKYIGFDAAGNPVLFTGAPSFVTTVAASGSGSFGGALTTAGYLEATGAIPGTLTGATAVYLGTASGFPYFALVNNGAAADTKVWDQYADANTLHMRVINDAMTVSQDWLQVVRSGATVTSITFPQGMVGIGAAPTVNQGALQLVGSSTGGVKLGNVDNTYANALDWYEEGSITPDLYVGGLITDSTYSARSGSYTRIGNRLFFDMLVQLNVKGAFTGSLAIGLLPYAAVAGSYPCSVKGSGLSLSSPGWLIAEGGNSQKVSLFTQSALGGVVALQGILANGCAIEVSGQFRVA